MSPQSEGVSHFAQDEEGRFQSFHEGEARLKETSGWLNRTVLELPTEKKKSSLIILANHILADTSWGQAPYLQLGHSFSLTFDTDWSLNYNHMMVFDQNECRGIKRKPQRCVFVLIARTHHSILGCCDTLRMTCSLPMRFDCTTLTTQRCDGDYKDYTVDSTMLPLCIYIHSCFTTWNANMAFIIILRHSCCPLYL